MTSLSPLFAYQSALRVPHNPSIDGAAPTPAPGVTSLTPAFQSPLLAYQAVLRAPHTPSIDGATSFPAHPLSVHPPARVPASICGAPRSPATRARVLTSFDAEPFGDLQPLSVPVTDGEFQNRIPASGVSSIADFQRFLLQSLQSPAISEPSYNPDPSGNPFVTLAQFSPPGFTNFVYDVYDSAGVPDKLVTTSSNSAAVTPASLNISAIPYLHSSYDVFLPVLFAAATSDNLRAPAVSFLQPWETIGGIVPLFKYIH